MRLRIFVILFSLLYAGSALAINLVGEGYGAGRKEAKKDAIAALSESLQVEVKSESRVIKSSHSGFEASSEVHTLSELPLLGVDYSFFNKKDEILCRAYFNIEKARHLYKEKLQILASSFEKMIQQNKQSLFSDQHHYLSELMSKHDQYGKYLLVARFIGLKDTPVLSMTASQIKNRLLSIESEVPDLDLAASLLTKDLPDERYYVYALQQQGSQEITELGRVLRDKVMSRIKTFDESRRATYILKGYYEIHQDSISVTYRVVDDYGETYATRVVKLAKAAYEKLSYKSSSIDFSKLLHDGYVVSNKFHSELNTNRGKTDLLFTDGEEVELFARLNGPGYFYIVVHNTTDGKSYLMDLNEAPGDRKFIQYVNADQANRWISLGSFEVGKPYGVENLQLIASNKDFVGQLPTNAYDNDSELYFLRENTVESALLKTRGLKRKKSKKQQALTAEATLTITTMRK